jgi:hypothetical protein
MFSLNACMPWTTKKSPAQQNAVRTQDPAPLFKRANLFEPAASNVTASRLAGTISDIKADMKSAGVFKSIPLQLPETTRNKLISAEQTFAGVDINHIDDYQPAANRPATGGVPEESQALRDILFSLQMLDFPLGEQDNFLVIQLLQRNDALSPSDLKYILDAFGRQNLGPESFTSYAADFMNTPNLSEPLTYELARAFVEISTKKFGPSMMNRCLKSLCAQLAQPVRDKLASYAVQSKMINRTNMTVTLVQPPERECARTITPAVECDAKTDQQNQTSTSPKPDPNCESAASTRPTIRALKPIRSAAAIKSVPLSQFYPTAKSNQKSLLY